MITKTFDLRGRKLFVATPTYDFKISMKTSVAMMELGYLCSKEGVALGHQSVCGSSIITSARNILADFFLQSDATDMLFLDSDIHFVPNDALKLLALTSKYSIVAGIPKQRKKDGGYMVKYDISPENGLIIDELGLVKAQRVSTAFMMIQRKVFEDLRDAHPEWKYPYAPMKQHMYAFFDFKLTPDGYLGEDYNFCDRARALGHQIWMDPSIKLGHLGMTTFEADLKQDLLEVFKEQQLEEQVKGDKPLDSAA